MARDNLLGDSQTLSSTHNSFQYLSIRATNSRDYQTTAKGNAAGEEDFVVEEAIQEVAMDTKIDEDKSQRTSQSIDISCQDAIHGYS
jgi:hypothetical protein